MGHRKFRQVCPFVTHSHNFFPVLITNFWNSRTCFHTQHLLYYPTSSRAMPFQKCELSQPFCLKYEHFCIKINSVFVVPVFNIPTNGVCSSLISLSSPLASSIPVSFSAGGRLQYVCACDMYVSAMSQLCQRAQALYKCGGQASHILKMKLHVQLQALAALSLVHTAQQVGLA